MQLFKTTTVKAVYVRLKRDAPVSTVLKLNHDSSDSNIMLLVTGLQLRKMCPRKYNAARTVAFENVSNFGNKFGSLLSVFHTSYLVFAF
jgi:hypothetical protein